MTIFMLPLYFIPEERCQTLRFGRTSNLSVSQSSVSVALAQGLLTAAAELLRLGSATPSPQGVWKVGRLEAVCPT